MTKKVYLEYIRPSFFLCLLLLHIQSILSLLSLSLTPNWKCHTAVAIWRHLPWIRWRLWPGWVIETLKSCVETIADCTPPTLPPIKLGMRLQSSSWTTGTEWVVLKSEIRLRATLLCVRSPLTFKCDYLVVIHIATLDKVTTLIKLQRERHHVAATHKKNKLISFFLVLKNS